MKAQVLITIVVIFAIAIIKIVQRYMDIDAWFDSTYITEKDFNHIQEIVKNAGELDKNAPYNKLVLTKYSKK